MKYTMEDVGQKLTELTDVIYLTHSDSDTYEAMKDDEVFRGLFGSSGSYQTMMNTFMENTIGKIVADSEQYSVFFRDAGRFRGRFSKKTRMRIGEKEAIINMTNLPLDENTNIILINYVDEEAYIAETHSDEKVNMIKSAYLFSMCIDIIGDTCSNMDMSEVDDNPVNALDITYTQWRETIVNMIWPDDQPAFREFTDPENLKKNLDYHRSRSIDCQMINLEGQFIWVKLIFNRIETGDDSEFRVVFVVEDIHESHNRLVSDLKKYEDMAMKDSLTGVYNHGRIEAELTECLEKSASDGSPVSLIMLDIDHFKNVNDTYGHAVGDYVLRTFAGMARKFFVPRGGVIGRWGGEEFLCVLSGVTAEKACELSEEFRKLTENTVFENAGRITSSFGVIQTAENETAADAFLRIDSALYEAKESGRNRVVRG